MVPGVYVQPRFGAADESQLSIRGSGLRNNFHARGVNILINGMPYRNADGFTDFESLDLTTTEAIAVYKGGNALRFGGSTMGGAINLQTSTGYTAPSISATAEGGSFGFSKGQLASGGHAGAVDWYGSFSRTRLGGYRDWSDQGRDRVNAHVGYLLSPSTDLRTFYLFAHVREHLPGSLTESDFEANPRAADPGNVASKWGRNYDLHHVGVQLRTQLSDGSRLEISPYGQYRDIDHPIFQVINQQSWDYGAEVRYENSDSLGSRASRLTVGFQPAFERMHNRQFQNVAGEHGDATKDQQDRVYGLAGYAEELLGLSSRLSLVAGVRLDHSIRKSADAFLADGDQSDRRVFNAILPKVGVLYQLPDSAGQLFANVSRSSEPPLLLELNSWPCPASSTSRRRMPGSSRWAPRPARGHRLGREPLRHRAQERDPQHQCPAVSRRAVHRADVPNSPRTRHYGVELGLDARPPGHLLSPADALTARVAYTIGAQPVRARLELCRQYDSRRAHAPPDGRAAVRSPVGPERHADGGVGTGHVLREQRQHRHQSRLVHRWPARGVGGAGGAAFGVRRGTEPHRAAPLAVGAGGQRQRQVLRADGRAIVLRGSEVESMRQFALMLAAAVAAIPTAACRSGPSFESPAALPQAGASASDPALVAEPGSGNILATWVAGDSSAWHLFFARSADAGATWSAPVRVTSIANDVEPHGEASPRLVAAPGGRLAVIWPRSIPVAGRQWPASAMRLARSLTEAAPGFPPSPSTTTRRASRPATISTAPPGWATRGSSPRGSTNATATASPNTTRTDCGGADLGAGRRGVRGLFARLRPHLGAQPSALGRGLPLLPRRARAGARRSGDRLMAAALSRQHPRHRGGAGIDRADGAGACAPG